MTAVSSSNINGQWQITPNGQLMMQGQESIGWKTGPYLAVVTFNQVTPGMLSGMTVAGEQVIWYRVA